MLAGEPLARPPEARVNLVEDQQCAVLVAEATEHLQKLLRRNVDAAARLHRLDEDRSDGTGFQQTADGVPGRSKLAASRWKGDEVTEVAKLRTEWGTKMIAMRGVERAITETVISAGEGNDLALAGGEDGGLQRSLDRFKAGIAEDGFRGSL